MTLGWVEGGEPCDWIVLVGSKGWLIWNVNGGRGCVIWWWKDHHLGWDCQCFLLFLIHVLDGVGLWLIVCLIWGEIVWTLFLFYFVGLGLSFVYGFVGGVLCLIWLWIVFFLLLLFWEVTCHVSVIEYGLYGLRFHDGLNVLRNHCLIFGGGYSDVVFELVLIGLLLLLFFILCFVFCFLLIVRFFVRFFSFVILFVQIVSFFLLNLFFLWLLFLIVLILFLFVCHNKLIFVIQLQDHYLLILFI